MDPSLYLDRDTFVHRLDPRTKMFLLLGMFVLAFVFTDPLYLLGVLAVVLFFGYLSRSLANLRRIWFILVAIAIVSIILWSIFGSGETPLFLFVEREALVYGVSIALRLDATIIAGMIFLSTTRNEEVAIGLVRLGIPYRFAFAVSTALRLVPTIVATGLTISQAQRSRGLDLDSGNIISRIRKHLPLLVPVFVTTVRSTNVFSMALESKGFGAGSGRTFFLHIAMGRRDVLVFAIFVLLLAGCITLRVMGYGELEGFSLT
jgi:energy-coupling factor transport system permease protein